MPTEYIDRPPRIQPELPIKEVEIPQPPEEGSRAGQDLLNLLIPLVTIIGFVLVSGTGNVLFIIPIGLAMVLTIGVTISGARRQRKELEAKKKAYLEKLAELRQDMNRAHNAQRIFYSHNYPEIPTVYEIAARKETSRFGPRLWERRTEDRDFGAVRLGMGTRPSSVVYRLSQAGNPLEEGPLAKDARKRENRGRRKPGWNPSTCKGSGNNFSKCKRWSTLKRSRLSAPSPQTPSVCRKSSRGWAAGSTVTC